MPKVVQHARVGHLGVTLLKMSVLRNQDLMQDLPPPGLRSAGGPKLLKWGLPGRGSNLLKFGRPLTSTTPPGGRAPSLVHARLGGSRALAARARRGCGLDLEGASGLSCTGYGFKCKVVRLVSRGVSRLSDAREGAVPNEQPCPCRAPVQPNVHISNSKLYRRHIL